MTRVVPRLLVVSALAVIITFSFLGFCNQLLDRRHVCLYGNGDCPWEHTARAQ